MSAVKPRFTMIEAAYGLLQFQLGDEKAAEIFRTLRISIRSCVLDTSSVLPLISYYLRKRTDLPEYELPLLVAADLGGVRLFVSITVREEVPRTILELCPHLIHMDPAEALDTWERDVLPRLIVVDPSELPLLSARVRVVDALDQTDVLTAQLIELCGPQAVYSDDKLHLGHFDILGQHNAKVSTAYRAKSQRDAGVLGIYTGADLVIILSVPAVEALLHALGKLDWRITLGVAALEPEVKIFRLGS